MKCDKCDKDIALVPGDPDYYVHLDLKAQIFGKWPIHKAKPKESDEQNR